EPGDLVEQLLVVGDHLPLESALGRVAENVEGTAAQPLALRQEAEDGTHPAAEPHLARLAGGLVAPRQQGRRQVELELAMALELLGQRLVEGRAREKACHLVLVL